MHRDMELIRTILREVRDRESAAFEEVEIRGAESWVVNRHVELLHQAGYLEAAPPQRFDGDVLIMVRDLTWAGHDFLGSFENDTVWAQMKEKLGPDELGRAPLKIVAEIGAKLSEAHLFKLAGLN